jgi:hypothetical protein
MLLSPFFSGLQMANWYAETRTPGGTIDCREPIAPHDDEPAHSRRLIAALSRQRRGWHG